MCEKCDKLRKAFQEAEGICEKQTLWREFDKQRRKCEGNLGILAPKKSKPEITVQEKKSRKKKTPKEEPTIEPIKTTNTECCKYLYKGGLCTNAQNLKPYCPCKGNVNTCPLKEKKE